MTDTDGSALASPEDWIEIGRILKPRGRIGELLAIFDSPKPDRADSLATVVLATREQRRQFDIEQVWYHDGRPVLKFAGIDSISDAELWAGATILVPESERVELEEGEFFHEDLVGCALEIAAPGEDSGEAVGRVQAVEEHGGPAVLRVKLDRDVGGAKAGKQVLIPFVGAICHDIDIAAKRIRADVPDGLFDL